MIRKYKKLLYDAIILYKSNIKELIMFSLINFLCCLLFYWCILYKSSSIVYFTLLLFSFCIWILTECGIVFYCNRSLLYFKPTIKLAYKFAQRNVIKYLILNIKVAMVIRLFMVTAVLLIGLPINLLYIMILLLIIMTIFYAKIILAIPIFVSKEDKGGELTMAMELAEGNIGLIALCIIPYIIIQIWPWIVTLIINFQVALSTNQYIAIAVVYSVILLLMYPFAYICLDLCFRNINPSKE